MKGHFQGPLGVQEPPLFSEAGDQKFDVRVFRVLACPWNPESFPLPDAEPVTPQPDDFCSSSTGDRSTSYMET